VSVERTRHGQWAVRWREAGRNRSRVVGRKRDAEALDAEIKRRRRMGELALADGGTVTLDEYTTGTWWQAHATALAPKTRRTYAHSYDLHVRPRLGSVPLRELHPDLVARWQGELLAAGVGGQAVRKAMVMLSSVLQRAAEGRLVPYNAARLVRKAPLPPSDAVRPLAPATVEAMRAAVGQRDATVISLLAYSGIRPQELRALRWRHVLERNLSVAAPKTRRRRVVRLLDPLAQDLREWRLVSGRPGDDAPVVPGEHGDEWTADGFNKWRGRVFRRALNEAGVTRARPYDLRHSFASLLLHEGWTSVYVAGQLGNGVGVCSDVYAHVIEELEHAPHVRAEDAIAAARRGEPVRPMYVTGGGA
jgi:integrase